MVPAQAALGPDARDRHESAARIDLRVAGAAHRVSAARRRQPARPRITRATNSYRPEHGTRRGRDGPAGADRRRHRLRAFENFPITGNPISIYPDLVRALACIKQAAALANRELGLLDKERADAIVKACEEIRDGSLHEHFVVDVIQGGAGTSTNMN